MQRFVARRVLSEANFLRVQQRCFTLAAADEKEVVNTDTPRPPVLPPFPYTPPRYTGPSGDEIMALRKKYVMQQAPYYKKPLNLVDGKMQYVFDENGKRYLDALAGVSVVSCGHCHPYVEEAIIKQMKSVQHTTVLYLNHTLTDYLQALADKMPGNLKVFYLLNSGTEANELAMLLARLYTGNNDIIALRNAYHGLAPATMSTNGLRIEKFNIVQTGILHALDPNPYRGDFGSDGKKYAQDVQNIIDYATSGKVAGFISETIQGVGGVVELAPGYLPAVYKSVREAGGVCIADEAITGFGRTGSHYWAFENQGVIPDIVTMAKGIGNGSPLSAVVTTPEIAEVLGRSTYYSTFAGNPISTTAGLATLNVIEKEGLQKNAYDVGSYLKKRLTALKHKYPIIGDVRGRGLMIGVELVEDRELKTPLPKKVSDEIHERLKDLGCLVGKAGLYSNVIRLLPPLCFNKEDADFLARALDYTLWNIRSVESSC
ncbi:Alanine--glyoxylate aminotransferase 2, mitochondrial-like protein [Melia azedarach]|uniref:Alanine--glyoxylate aminotransferase 2, mitochondrial-like protein n=1 Tax=Melia azedarach TaxID=155640 RepID=A0ACC1WYZ0_MELAZ|nr:Alanine--glyoxylate aminotransferase 2, mitochondrial-like protein [Melia azedarach]